MRHVRAMLAMRSLGTMPSKDHPAIGPLLFYLYSLVSSFNFDPASANDAEGNQDRTGENAGTQPRLHFFYLLGPSRWHGLWLAPESFID
ncbi:MAG: hypothetical protein KDK37_16845 [Leptospiraceae bacterium]|nr:hypothetical protein [Leptospiraceae bacterium]